MLTVGAVPPTVTVLKAMSNVLVLFSWRILYRVPPVYHSGPVEYNLMTSFADDA